MLRATTTLPKAKLSPLLTDTEALLRGTALTDIVRTGGRRWKLRSLEQPEETWIDANTDGINLYQVGRARHEPAIAAALVAIGVDGGPDLPDTDSCHPSLTPVEELWALPDDVTPEQRQMLTDPAAVVEWRRGEILAWLRSIAVAPAVVGQLYNGYLSLAYRRQEALKKLGPFEINPLTGRSLDASLLEKGF